MGRFVLMSLNTIAEEVRRLASSHPLYDEILRRSFRWAAKGIFLFASITEETARSTPRANNG